MKSASGWLLVAGNFTPLGGMDRANHALAKYLAGRGRVHLVTHRAWPDLGQHPNVTVHLTQRPFGRHLLGNPLLAWAGRRWAGRLVREGVRVVVNGGNCLWDDVNWVHCVHSAYAPAATSTGIRRLTARLHRTSALRGERALLAARVVVCNSQRTARDVVEHLGVQPDRIRVVYLAADEGTRTPISLVRRSHMRAKLGWGGRPWMLFAGSVGDWRKNFDTLYAAWRELCRDRFWDAGLAVAGRELQPWRARADADGLGDRIRFLGFREDLANILPVCDAVVHPARYDAYGLVSHEALCLGVPALVSVRAGISERYPTELGDLLLTEPEDPAALADRLRAWRRTLESWPARVAPLAASLRAYSWDDMAREFVKAVSA